MPDPINFDTASPRLGLPLLYAGQSQKEFYVNEAHALIDSLLHGAIENVANTPPATPGAGQTWLVGAAPTADWSGQAGKLASWQGVGWLFTTPRDGMRILNRANGQDMRYFGGWLTPTAATAPSGGSTIDVQARVAISQLISALSAAGVFPAT